jgi:phosphate transport system protein
MATRIAFGEKLEQLKIDLLKMGNLVEEGIVKASHALVKTDRAVAEQVIAGDEKINEKEGTIEDECVILLATEQPVAGDLRFIISTLNTIRDLERIGDYAVHLAKITEEIDDIGIVFEKEFSEIAGICSTMFKDALRAFAEQNGDLAREVSGRDRVVDALYLTLFKNILCSVDDDENRRQAVVQLVFAVKYLERLADHIVNICEEVEYMCTGTRKDYGTH